MRGLEHGGCGSSRGKSRIVTCRLSRIRGLPE